MMKAGKIPEWNIPPSKEVCHRNLNSAKTRLRRPESQKIINDANQLKKDVAKVATQDEGIEFTRYNMDQFHIGQERDLLKTGRPNINPQALLVPSSRVKTPPISFFGTGRRPSTSPCQTNHLLLKGNNVENDYIIHNSHLGRTNRTPVLTKTEFSRTLDQHSLKGASGFSPKGVLSLPTAQFPLHSSNHNAVDRTSGHVTSQARLQVPECREGTPRDSKRTDPEDSQMSRVYFLTQEPQVKPQKSIVVMTEADSDEYDTDCEPESK
ncbi:hypothetical protein BgiMline_009642 [Biomphalaria glabrata]|nr:hypothetical protein BgiMline_023761 [Biomphalaria glabrata]